VHAAADSYAAALDVASPNVIWPIGGRLDDGEAGGSSTGGRNHMFDKQMWLQVSGSGRPVGICIGWGRWQVQPKVDGAEGPAAASIRLQPARYSLCLLSEKNLPLQPTNHQVLAEINLSDDQMRELLQLRGQLLESLGHTLAERRGLAERLLTGDDESAGGVAGQGFWLACWWCWTTVASHLRLILDALPPPPPFPR